MPFELLPLTIWRLLRLVVPSVFAANANGGWRFHWRRLPVILLFLPLFAILQLCHWIGFLLDELLFRGYRKVAIERPVFVLGVPRSGTTFLHRALARDPQFTTFATWECLFAPSVTQRRILLAVAALDRRCGAPLAKLVRWIETHAFRGLEGVHQVRLDEAEEDYLTLLPILRCFILVVPFPLAEDIWRVGSFDRDISESERKHMMAYYRACLQKHLYTHGPRKTLLSKNASFAPLAHTLSVEFPDARFIACLRPPIEALPSQLSSIAAGVEFFASDPESGYYRNRMLELFPFFYGNLISALESEAKGRHVFIDMSELRMDIATKVEAAYDQLGIPLSDVFRAALAEENEKARRYASPHHYNLDLVGLDSAEVQEKFAGVYSRMASAGRNGEGQRKEPDGAHLARPEDGN